METSLTLSEDLSLVICGSTFPTPSSVFHGFSTGRVRYKLVRPSSTFTNPPPLTPQQAFTLSVDPACPDGSFFYEDIFDFLPFEDYPKDDTTVPVCCLHLSGYAKEWIAQTTVIDPLFATIDDDDSSVGTCPSAFSTDSDNSSVTTSSSKDTKFHPVDDGILRFTSQAAIPPELEPIYHHLKSQWDSGPVVITPSHKHNSSSHLLNTKLMSS